MQKILISFDTGRWCGTCSNSCSNVHSAPDHLWGPVVRLLSPCQGLVRRVYATLAEKREQLSFSYWIVTKKNVASVVAVGFLSHVDITERSMDGEKELASLLRMINVESSGFLGL